MSNENITAAAILFAGVLNDDEIIEYNKGEKYILKWYTYASEWHNDEHAKEFDTSEAALDFYQSELPDRLPLQVKYMNEDYMLENPKDYDENGDYWNSVDDYACTILDVFAK